MLGLASYATSGVVRKPVDWATVWNEATPSYLLVPPPPSAQPVSDVYAPALVAVSDVPPTDRTPAAAAGHSAPAAEPSSPAEATNVMLV